MDIKKYWASIAIQDEAEILSYFDEKAEIVWPNTGERFNPAQFAHINAIYPGSWHCEVKKVLQIGELYITVVRIYNAEASLHASSFITVRNGKIIKLEEYFAEDAEIPDWRKNLPLL